MPLDQPYSTRDDMLMVDRASRTVVGTARVMDACSDLSHAAKFRILTQALIAYAQAHTVQTCTCPAGTVCCADGPLPLNFLTLGTADRQPDNLRAYMSQLTRYLAGRLWTCVLERGSTGKRWHAHLVVSGHLSWQELRDTWWEIAGHGTHVRSIPVRDDGIAHYLAGYLAKSAGDRVSGMRQRSSSKRLRRIVSAYIPPQPKRKLIVQTFGADVYQLFGDVGAPDPQWQNSSATERGPA